MRPKRPRDEGILPLVRRLAGGTKAAVLTAGALAGAIAAVIALLPHHAPPPPAAARWETPVINAQDETLGDFADRVEARRVIAERDPSARRGRPAVRLVALTGEPGALLAERKTTTYSGPAPTRRHARHVIRVARYPPPGYARGVVARVARQVAVPRVCRRSPTRPGCGLRALLPAVARDRRGNLVPVIEAARRLVAYLASVRHARGQPLGVDLALSLELIGLEGAPVVVTFQVYALDGSLASPPQWKDTFVAFRITPRSDREPQSTMLWVPEPRARERYHVEFYVSGDGQNLPWANSPPWR